MLPFLDAGAFAAMFGRALSSAESAQATPLLEVVSSWIREQKPDIIASDPAAKVVTFEVVRDALVYGKYGPLSSFQDTTGDRTKAGTLDASSVVRFITDRHREMLGIQSGIARARGRFTVCDY